MKIKNPWANILATNNYNFTYITFFFVIVLQFKAISTECDSREFECDNGICIRSNLLCDGARNCSDGSDETAKYCIHQRMYCDMTYFTCSYGACVIGTASCNGVRDCADGSDETLQRCGDEYAITAYERTLQNNCNYGEFKCPSGICLPNEKKCDGQNDCGDSFDESVEQCAHIQCPEYTFTCGYGACIESNLKCNRQNDCVDGSDEAPLLCNYNRTSIDIHSREYIEQTDGCPMPRENDPERPIMRHGINLALLQSIKFGPVQFSCNVGDTLVGKNVSFCANKKWNVDVPKCQKFCDTTEIVNGYTTVATCQLKNQKISCKRKMQPGTEVTFLCATYFTYRTSLPTLKCMNGGVWSGLRPQCESECGEIATPTKEFSAHGFQVPNFDVPWHVGLYANFNGQKFQNICGGTILTPYLVITAAHCIWDKARESPYSPDLFQIAGAKFFSDYYKTEKSAIIRNVADIKVHSKFKGVVAEYVNDIALLILEQPLVFSNDVRPICLHFYTNSEKEAITNGIKGRFAGWGIEGNRTLQTVDATSMTNSNCKKTVYNLATDKFCVNSDTNAKSCSGDSGGGFTYVAIIKDQIQSYYRHNLLGVISHAPGSDQCQHTVLALTNVQYFQKFIEMCMEESKKKG